MNKRMVPEVPRPATTTGATMAVEPNLLRRALAYSIVHAWRFAESQRAAMAELLADPLAGAEHPAYRELSGLLDNVNAWQPMPGMFELALGRELRDGETPDLAIQVLFRKITDGDL